MRQLKGPYKRQDDRIIDGSGEMLAAISWGCGCCQGPLLKDEIEIGDKIVNALNSHAALLEALKGFMVLDWSKPQTAIGMNQMLAEAARKAIAQAEGGA